MKLIGAKIGSMTEALRFIGSEEYGARLVVIWSYPGEGKTVLAHLFAEQMGMEVVEVRATRLVPEDVGGFPTANYDQKVMSFFPPEWLPKIFFTDKRVLVIMDELNDARQDVIHALQGIVCDIFAVQDTHGLLQYGIERKPNRRVWFVALANPPGVSRGDYPLTLAFCNRAAHFTLVPDEEDDERWLDWMVERKTKDLPVIQHPPIEKQRENFLQANMLITAFLRVFPQYRRKVEIKRDEPVYPSRRTWDICARMMALTEMTQAEWELVVSATVGSNIAAAFLEYMQSTDIPPITEVIKNPSILKDYLSPQRPDIAYSIVSGVCAIVASMGSEELVDFIRNGTFQTLMSHYKNAYLSDMAEKLRSSVAKCLLEEGILDADVVAEVNKK